jgi:hypothetical protein
MFTRFAYLYMLYKLQKALKVGCDMVHGISEIVDFLLAQVQRVGGVEKIDPGRPDDGGERMNWLSQTDDLGGLAASGHGLCPATVVDLISEDMLSEEERPLYFPAPPVEKPGIACHRMVVVTETGIPPMALTVYYNPGGGLNISQPRYVVDNDIWVHNSGRFWSFISVVIGSGDEARRFIETFISRLGFGSSFEVTEEGDRLLLTRLRRH